MVGNGLSELEDAAPHILSDADASVAAVKIQSVIRGRARVELSGLPSDKSKVKIKRGTGAEMSDADAALKIQSILRGRATRNELKGLSTEKTQLYHLSNQGTPGWTRTSDS